MGHVWSRPLTDSVCGCATSLRSHKVSAFGLGRLCEHTGIATRVTKCIVCCTHQDRLLTDKALYKNWLIEPYAAFRKRLSMVFHLYTHKSAICRIACIREHVCVS